MTKTELNDYTIEMQANLKRMKQKADYNMQKLAEVEAKLQYAKRLIEELNA